MDSSQTCMSSSPCFPTGDIFSFKLPLNDGNMMPIFGLGTYQSPPQEAYNAVKWALEMGYRHIDTAAMYRNEHAIGQAIRDSGIDRSEIFVTTKLLPQKGGYERTIAECEKSLKNLGMDYVDLYLM